MFNGSPLDSEAIGAAPGAERCCPDSAVFGAAAVGAWCFNGGSPCAVGQGGADGQAELAGVEAQGQVGGLVASVVGPEPAPAPSPGGGGGGPGAQAPFGLDARVSVRGVSARASVGSLALWASEAEQDAAFSEAEQPGCLAPASTPLATRLRPLAEPRVTASASAGLAGLEALAVGPPPLALGEPEAYFDAELEDAALLALEMTL